MIIKKFSAAGFRNIEKCSIEFSEGLNLLHGMNAQGKTNALEGIYVFARGRSFRAREDKELVRFGSDGFNLKIEYSDKNGEQSLEYSLYGRERLRKKNGYRLKGVSEMLGSFRAVLFYPDNLEIVKGGPDERRDFLNIAISQCYPEYVKYYSSYKKALENRNCLLKAAQKGLFADENEIYSWSYVMAEYASFIYIMRDEYVERIKPHSSRIMSEISSGKEKMDIEYSSDIPAGIKDRTKVKEEYVRVFTSSIDREKSAGVSLYGPHRDDLLIKINGNNSRIYASQGQQRSLVLALKLSEGEVIKDICGEYPIYLFDDVLSELDAGRREYVLKGLEGKQIIITSCESEEYENLGARIIEVTEGDYVSAYRQ
ncbi:MAG: DNA replication/repair protein RecF [Clostridia bacterium]|nr:DNA replication/repair protein RecF [Clostridia bacterium]